MLSSATEMHEDTMGPRIKRGPTLKGLLTNMAMRSGGNTPDRKMSKGGILDLAKLKEVANILDEQTPGTLEKISEIKFEKKCNLSFTFLKFVNF